MNLNLINLKPTEWSKDDWRDAYEQYCKANMFGPKTKREYYDMVLERHKRMEENNKPFPQELLKKWSDGRKAAKAWAQKRGCDLNGRMLSEVRAETENRDIREIAERAEEMGIESIQRLDDLDERINQARIKRMKR